MSNPWLKKNPFMSLWLSAANSAANRVRGQIAAGAKRQSQTAAAQATQEVLNFWAGALAGAPKPRARRRTKR